MKEEKEGGRGANVMIAWHAGGAWLKRRLYGASKHAGALFGRARDPNPQPRRRRWVDLTLP
eukprot:3008555-Pleurochrysis_carterae.AAC.3